MCKKTENEIDTLDFHGVKNFFRKNDVTKLPRKSKYKLLIRIAELDSKYQFTSYSNIILDSFKTHGEGFRFWAAIIITNLIAIISLILSILKK